jgi:hypothetical protein
MNLLVLLLAILLAASVPARAQTLQGSRFGDVSLGRWGDVEGGGGFGYRHDHSFALRTPGMRRDDMYATFSLRIPTRRTDVSFGLYGAWQNVGRMWWPKHELNEYRNFVNGNPEASGFLFVSMPFGDLGVRVGAVHSFDDDNSASTWLTAAAAARTRPIDALQLLPNTNGLRSSVHYRIDYGVVFLQTDLGFDYRWARERPTERRQNADGEIVYFAVTAGIGLAHWGLTYGMAHVWAATRIFDRVDTVDAWKTSTTPNGNRNRAAAHSLAFHWYHRHWSPYLGLTLIAARREDTALSAGVDYLF